MLIDLTGGTIILSCTDALVKVEKNKLKIFRYFNTIFEDEPNIEKIELKETTENVLPVLKFISNKEDDIKERNLKMISYYFFKWDAIVVDTVELKFSDMVVKCTGVDNNDIYTENKDAFEYFCKWVAYHLCSTGLSICFDTNSKEPRYTLTSLNSESVDKCIPKVGDMIRHVTYKDEKYFYSILKKEYIPEQLYRSADQIDEIFDM